MKRLLMGTSLLLTTLLFFASHSFAGAQEQIAQMNAQMKGARGVTVKDHHGNDVGRVVALAGNDETAYFMVALNGNEGKITPIPFTAARFDPQSQTLVLLDGSASGLAQAPAPLPGHAEPGDSESDDQGHAYYGHESDQQHDPGAMDAEPPAQRKLNI